MSSFCGELGTVTGIPPCWETAQPILDDIIPKMIAEMCRNNTLGCGLVRDGDDQIAVATSGIYGDMGYASPDTQGDVVYCDSNGALRTRPRSTSTYGSAAGGVVLSGTITGTGSETVITGSQILNLLTVANPSNVRPLNIFYQVGARLAIGLPNPNIGSRVAYIKLQVRLNGGAWNTAMTVYRDEVLFPNTQIEGGDIETRPAYIAQIAPGDNAIIDVRALHFATNLIDSNYIFATPNATLIGVTA